MRRLFTLVFGIAVGFGLAYFTGTHHIVRGTGQTILVPKAQAGWVDTYNDIREWSPRDWKSHPELAQAMIKQGHGDMIRGSVAGSIGHEVHGMIHEAEEAIHDLGDSFLPPVHSQPSRTKVTTGAAQRDFRYAR